MGLNNRVNRRQFLRAQGALLTLPFMPSLAKTDIIKPAKRLVIMYIPNGIVRRCFFPGEEEKVIGKKLKRSIDFHTVLSDDLFE